MRRRSSQNKIGSSMILFSEISNFLSAVMAVVPMAETVAVTVARARAARALGLGEGGGERGGGRVGWWCWWWCGWWCSVESSRWPKHRRSNCVRTVSSRDDLMTGLILLCPGGYKLCEPLATAGSCWGRERASWPTWRPSVTQPSRPRKRSASECRSRPIRSPSPNSRALACKLC